MPKSTALTTLILAFSYSIFILYSSPPSKPHYHKLFLSPSFSSNVSISQNLRILTRHPHVAGTKANAKVAAYVNSIFISTSLNSRIVTYKVSLTYLLHRSLILTPNHSSKPITFKLEQEQIGDNPYTNEVTPTFHGYAKSGNVSGPVVYANYGRVEDFIKLKEELNVNVSGSVVIAKYKK